MSGVLERHRQAMEMADSTFLARRNGQEEKAQEIFRQAFAHEREDAEMVAPELEMEPTRSVLHRSAATLALDCGEFREAERLIARALCGNPPEEIAEELRELLQQVYAGWGYRRR